MDDTKIKYDDAGFIRGHIGEQEVIFDPVTKASWMLSGDYWADKEVWARALEHRKTAGKA